MLDPEANSAVVYLETCHWHPKVFQSTSGASPEGCVDRTLNVDLVFMLSGDCKFRRVGKDWALPCFPLHIYGVQPAALRAITRLHRCPLEDDFALELLQDVEGEMLSLTDDYPAENFQAWICTCHAKYTSCQLSLVPFR